MRYENSLQVYLGLGTNLGARAHNLSQALQWLAGLPGGGLSRLSSVYQTAPWGVEEQPDFYNMVVQIRTSLSPHELLAELKQVETTLGRVPGERWGPRLIDLDILLYEGVEIADETLQIPHARVRERQFVLVPLAEIAPEVEVGEGYLASQLALPDSSEITRLGRLAHILRNDQATR